MTKNTELATTAPPPDAQTLARVVDSIVVRGDLSGLSPVDRARFYVQTCEGLGLNPAARPFDFLRLQGKEVMYANRNAADQLAAIHRVTRKIIDGPKIIDLAGTKLVYAVCEASLPNGRVETSTATVPLVDPVNVLMKCECVPLGSEILTRRGFRAHDEIRIGEEVLAYDRERDICEWVPLEDVSIYHGAEIATLHTPEGQFSVECTPNHSWAVEVPARTSRRNELVEAQAIKTHHRLILAAPAPGGNHRLSPERAAVLGWVMCDGTIQRRGSYVRLGIYQSKPERVVEIRAALDAAGLTYTEGVGEATEREFPSGETYDCLPQHAFWLDGDTSWWLLQEAGLAGPEGLPELVTHLSWAAREAMLNAMLAADGDARGNFGKKRKPGVMDAFQILSTLQGRALGMLRQSSTGEVPIQRAMSTRYVAGSNLSITPAGKGSVWCPTTRHGTWVMRQRGRITITGNTKAKRRATLSILSLGMLDEMELETIPKAVQEPGGGVDLSVLEPPPAKAAPAQPAVDLQEVEAEESAPSSRAFATFLEKISSAQALVMVFDLYAALLAGLREEGNDAEEFTSGDDGAGAQARQRIIALGHKLAKAECQQVLLSRALAEILDAQGGIAPGPNALQTAADWWITHRDAAKERLDAAHRQTPWYALVRRYSGAQNGPDTQRAGKALDAAVKLREKSPPPGGGGGGGQGPQRAAAADAHGHAQETSAAAGATARTAIEEFRAHLASIPDRGTDRGAGRIAGAFWKRREGFIEEGTHAEAMGLVIDALHARGVSEPSPWLQQIGEQNGYVQRPRKVA